MALSAKHRAFVEAYLETWNATEAYCRVYPKSSRESARRDGSRLLTNADISAEIQRLIDERSMGANEVLDRLAEQARGAHGRYITPDGAVDLSTLITDGKGHLIKGIKETQHGRNIEFYDAQAALTLIGRHHGIFKDKVDVNLSGNVGFNADEAAQAERELKEFDEQRGRGDPPAPTD